MKKILILSSALLVSSPALAQYLLVNQFKGADVGAQINNCLLALPASGGVCDARALQGTLTVSTNPYNGVTNPTVLLLGNATFVSTPQWGSLPSGTAIIGEGMGVTIIQQTANNSPVLTAGLLQVASGASNVILRDFTVDMNDLNNTSATQLRGVKFLGANVASRVERVEVKNLEGSPAGAMASY